MLGMAVGHSFMGGSAALLGMAVVGAVIELLAEDGELMSPS